MLPPSPLSKLKLFNFGKAPGPGRPRDEQCERVYDVVGYGGHSDNGILNRDPDREASALRHRSGKKRTARVAH